MNNIWHRMTVILHRYGTRNVKVSPNERSSDCSGRSFLKSRSSSSALPGVTPLVLRPDRGERCGLRQPRRSCTVLWRDRRPAPAALGLAGRVRAIRGVRHESDSSQVGAGCRRTCRCGRASRSPCHADPRPLLIGARDRCVDLSPVRCCGLPAPITLRTRHRRDALTTCCTLVPDRGCWDAAVQPGGLIAGEPRSTGLHRERAKPNSPTVSAKRSSAWSETDVDRVATSLSTHVDRDRVSS